MLIRSAAGQALALTRLRMMCLGGAHALRAMIHHGCLYPPARILANHAGMRGSFLGNARGMRRYAEAALHWAERMPDPLIGPQAEVLVHVYTNAWTGSRHAILEPLKRLAQTLQELGDIEYSAHALLLRGHYMGLTGVSLRDVVDHFARLPRRGNRSTIEEPQRASLPYRVLMGSEGSLAEFADARGELERCASTAQFAATHWMLALCVFGDFNGAWWTSELVRPIIFERISAPSHVADYLLFRGLTAAVCARTESGLRRWRLLRAAASSFRALRQRAQDGPDFVHMAELLRAERSWTAGQTVRALDLLARAAAGADACGYIHHSALAHERRSALLLELGRQAEASEARRRACERYRAWGAEGKARSLDPNG
jgi:hypothetical protein